MYRVLPYYSLSPPTPPTPESLARDLERAVRDNNLALARQAFETAFWHGLPLKPTQEHLLLSLKNAHVALAKLLSTYGATLEPNLACAQLALSPFLGKEMRPLLGKVGILCEEKLHAHELCSDCHRMIEVVCKDISVTAWKDLVLSLPGPQDRRFFSAAHGHAFLRLPVKELLTPEYREMVSLFMQKGLYSPPYWRVSEMINHLFITYPRGDLPLWAREFVVQLKKDGADFSSVLQERAVRDFLGKEEPGMAEVLLDIGVGRYQDISWEGVFRRHVLHAKNDLLYRKFLLKVEAKTREERAKTEKAAAPAVVFDRAFQEAATCHRLSLLSGKEMVSERNMPDVFSAHMNRTYRATADQTRDMIDTLHKSYPAGIFPSSTQKFVSTLREGGANFSRVASGDDFPGHRYLGTRTPGMARLLFRLDVLQHFHFDQRHLYSYMMGRRQKEQDDFEDFRRELSLKKYQNPPPTGWNLR